MSLQKLQKQAARLSVSDRLELVNAIVCSLREELRPQPDLKGAIERLRGIADTNEDSDLQDRRQKKGSAHRLIGLAKTDTPPPTDEEVEAMLEERRANKYLK